MNEIVNFLFLASHFLRPSSLYCSCINVLSGQALAADGPNFVVSPYTLLLCPDGRVTFTESIDTTVPDLRNFIPPEGLVGINIFSELVVEKVSRVYFCIKLLMF